VDINKDKNMKELELPTGIELMKIDVTQYIKDTFHRANLISYPNGSFIFKLEDSINPAVPNNFISYRGSGILNGSYISGLNIEFYHDLTYTNGKTLEMTECVYQIDEIEDLILNYL
jgi:hypothetical protein